jgi:hypothetical protein
VFHKTHKTTFTLSPITVHQTKNTTVHNEVQYLLLSHQRCQKSRPVDPKERLCSQTEQTPEIKEQAEYMPVIHFLSAGICVGMISSIIMYGSIKIVLKQYGENPTLHGALDHVVYGLLWLGTHVFSLSYAIVCMVCAFLLTKNGSTHFQRLLNENTDNFWNSQSVFLGAVFSEVGFLLGSTLMDFAFESMLGFPPSYSMVTFVMMQDLLVCCLLIQFYDWGIVDGEESNEESKVHKEDMYIAIV